MTKSAASDLLTRIALVLTLTGMLILFMRHL